MLDGLIGYLKEFFFWMWDWVINWFYDAFASIAAYFLDLAEVNGLTIDPADLTDKINTLYSLLDTVNQWLPIHAVIGLVTVEWSIRLSIRGVRWIIGFIPTVEG
jgi:hypothetical protein